MRLSFVFFILFSQPLWAMTLPSSVGVSQSFDNDRNSNTSLDFTLGTNFGAMLSAGGSFSRFQYGDSESERGNNTTLFGGVQSNPLRDWIFGVNGAYTKVSSQMRIYDPSVFIKNYFWRLNWRLDVGYRTIILDTPQDFPLLVQNIPDPAKDENFWWQLGVDLDLSKNFVVGASYKQYQYSLRFDFFNYPVAQTIGYNLDTINYGAGFPDSIAVVHANYFRNRWDFALTYSFVQNEFDDSLTYTWTPSAGFALNDHWYFNMSLGFSRGVTEEDNNSEQQLDRTGSFFSLATTYTF